ncbi:hypothetical protein Y032_0481g2253 [Ancylostoma ceylanicum]|uniref:Elongation of very long chain fatty acids protein n=1 Tax=Ancylostoma ceylanicum TaxID=53326 RepID=A0A016WVR4_9BILA|nr:hypothetical protein Y032_0481g2253 [Ancylostoma ceylanicum]
MFDTFPADEARKWTADHTPHVWLISACYLGFVLTAPGKIVMKHGLLPQWYYYNGLLQLCLLVAFVPHVTFSLTAGWRDSVCCNHSLYSGALSGTVMFLFVFSKLLDLAETVLIILEGRQPLLIHIFHHIITLLVTWHSYSHHHSLGRWFVFINLFSHVILYSYLSPKKFGIAPCWLFVAFTQVYQLVFCLIICFTAQNYNTAPNLCKKDAPDAFLRRKASHAHTSPQNGAFAILKTDSYSARCGKANHTRFTVFGSCKLFSYLKKLLRH